MSHLTIHNNLVLIPSSSPLTMFKPKLLKQIFMALAQFEEGSFNISKVRSGDGEFNYHFQFPYGLTSQTDAVLFHVQMEEVLRTMTLGEIIQRINGHTDGTTPLSPYGELNKIILDVKPVFGQQVKTSVDVLEYCPEITRDERICSLNVELTIECTDTFKFIVTRHQPGYFTIDNVTDGLNPLDDETLTPSKKLKRLNGQEVFDVLLRDIAETTVKAFPNVQKLITLLKSKNVGNLRVANGPGRTLTISFEKLPIAIDFDARTSTFDLIGLYEGGREAIYGTQIIKEVVDWVIEQTLPSGLSIFKAGGDMRQLCIELQKKFGDRVSFINPSKRLAKDGSYHCDLMVTKDNGEYEYFNIEHRLVEGFGLSLTQDLLGTFDAHDHHAQTVEQALAWIVNSFEQTKKS